MSSILWSLAKVTGKTAVLAAKGAYYGVGAATTVAAWGIHAVGKGTGLAIDLATAQSLGEIKCPNGHEIETTGQYECGACGFTYEGSIWYCPAGECPAPITPHISCDICGLSVANPMRIRL